MLQIGRYKVERELGRGAMGVVYLATDPSIGRPVAIKTIRIRDINDTRHRDKLRERLFREARSAGVLSHPNIVTIYDMDEVDDLAYIAMAFVNGPTLEKILASDQPLSGLKMLRILRQTATALDYAHSRGIVHRDVKPANIMTDEDGAVKITDFGIARITEGAQSTETKTVAGTPNYMSPEQVQGFAVDGRSDQFSLAVIAFEILTGERPFIGEHLCTIVFKIVAEEPPSAHRVNTTLTPRIDEVLRKGLSKKPEDRFPNCASFVAALEMACGESRGWKTLPAGAAAALPTIGFDRPAPPPAVTLPPPRVSADPDPPRKFGFLAAFLSFALVSGVGALFLYQAGLIGGATQKSPEPAPVVVPLPEPERKPDPASPTPASPTLPAPALPIPNDTAESAPPPETAKPSPLPAPGPTRATLQDVWVTSNPPGAKAVLDNNLSADCRTPCMLHALPGRHSIAVSQAGYLNEYREITVGATAVDVPEITLQQPPNPVEGTLFLSTVPQGAMIRIDGRAIPQLTNAQLTLPAGSHSVTVERNGIIKTEKVRIGDSVVRLLIPLDH